MESSQMCTVNFGTLGNDMNNMKSVKTLTASCL